MFAQFADNAGFSRRSLLQRSGMGLASLGLADLLVGSDPKTAQLEFANCCAGATRPA